MLTPKQRKHLKGLAHPLKPVVQVGKREPGETLFNEVDQGLLAHELIKVHFQKSAVDDLETSLKRILDHTHAELVEVRGHIAVLYRPHPDNPKIRL